MERKYFDCNVSEYTSAVDNVYDMAEAAIDKNPFKKREIIRYATLYAEKMADYYNYNSKIASIEPGEKQCELYERNMRFLHDIERYKDIIMQLVNKKKPIRDDDEDIEERLRERIEVLEKKQSNMHYINAYYRKHQTLKGCDILPEDQMQRIEEDMKERGEEKPFSTRIMKNNSVYLNKARYRLRDLKK